jgi:hypothetical protein
MLSTKSKNTFDGKTGWFVVFKKTTKSLQTLVKSHLVKMTKSYTETNYTNNRSSSKGKRYIQKEKLKKQEEEIFEIENEDFKEKAKSYLQSLAKNHTVEILCQLQGFSEKLTFCQSWQLTLNNVGKLTQTKLNLEKIGME